MSTSLAVTSYRFEHGPIAAAVELYEFYLLQSNESVSEYDTQNDDFDADDNTKAAGEAWFPEDTGELENIDPRPPVCHFRVSTQCMILASSVFRAMLQGGFKESLKLDLAGELRRRSRRLLDSVGYPSPTHRKGSAFDQSGAVNETRNLGR